MLVFSAHTTNIRQAPVFRFYRYPQLEKEWNIFYLQVCLEEDLPKKEAKGQQGSSVAKKITKKEIFKGKSLDLN